MASPMTRSWEPGIDVMGRVLKFLGDRTVTELDRFRLYYVANGRPKADWDAAFELWCRDAEEKPARASRARATPGRPGNKKTQDQSEGPTVPLMERVDAYLAALPEGHELKTEDPEDFYRMARTLGLEDYTGDLTKPFECFAAFIVAEYPTEYLWEAVDLWHLENPDPPRSSTAFRAIWSRYCPRSGFGGAPVGGRMIALRKRLGELRAARQ